MSLILQSIDRIKEIMGELEANQTEPAGSDEDLISQLDRISAGGSADEAGAANLKIRKSPLWCEPV